MNLIPVDFKALSKLKIIDYCNIPISREKHNQKSKAQMYSSVIKLTTDVVSFTFWWLLHKSSILVSGSKSAVDAVMGSAFDKWAALSHIPVEMCRNQRESTGGGFLKSTESDEKYELFKKNKQDYP